MKKHLENLIKKKWIIVVALSVVTVSLLVTTVHVYAMSKENKENLISYLNGNVKKVQEMKDRNARHERNGEAAALVLPAQEVAAAEVVAEEGAAPEAAAAEVVAAEAVAAEAVAAEAVVADAIPVEAAPAPEVIPEEVYVEETYVEEWVYEDTAATAAPAAMDAYYTAGDLRFHGVLYAGGWRWTWYSQNVLPGGGLAIPGRHVDESGFVCDANGRICLASSDLPWGSIVATPFGKEGCVYDCGCASGTLDVYVDF